LFGVPVNGSNGNASSVLSRTNCGRIARYVNNGSNALWEEYYTSPVNGGVNFNLSLGEGYFAKCDNNVTLNLSGRKVEGFNSTLFYEWNIMAWTNVTGTSNASRVLNNIPNAYRIARYANNGDGNALWEEYYTSPVSGGTDFTVNHTQGYFIKTSQTTSWVRMSVLGGKTLLGTAISLPNSSGGGGYYKTMPCYAQLLYGTVKYPNGSSPTTAQYKNITLEKRNIGVYFTVYGANNRYNSTYYAANSHTYNSGSLFITINFPAVIYNVDGEEGKKENISGCINQGTDKINLTVTDGVLAGFKRVTTSGETTNFGEIVLTQATTTTTRTTTTTTTTTRATTTSTTTTTRRTTTTLALGNPKLPKCHNDKCTPTYPCSRGLGDCDTNRDCVNSICEYDVGREYGCNPTVDMCI